MGAKVKIFSTKFKMSVKFYYKEMPLLERIFTTYLDTNTRDTYEQQEVEALLQRLYRDDEKNIQAHIKFLKSKGFEK